MIVVKQVVQHRKNSHKKVVKIKGRKGQRGVSLGVGTFFTATKHPIDDLQLYDVIQGPSTPSSFYGTSMGAPHPPVPIKLDPAPGTGAA
jgi:hypothetical protein